MSGYFEELHTALLIDFVAYFILLGTAYVALRWESVGRWILVIVGGPLSGLSLYSLIIFIILLVSGYTVFTFGLLVNGWVQLCYSGYEGYMYGHVTRFRYIIYICVFVFWLIIWMVK
jgi:hypothetical protein